MRCNQYIDFFLNGLASFWKCNLLGGFILLTFIQCFIQYRDLY